MIIAARVFFLGWAVAVGAVQAGSDDFFRINQVGYGKEDAKIGLIGSKNQSSPAGRKFLVVKAADANAIVYTGTVGASRPIKDTPFTGVFPCDFSVVNQEGEYKLKLEDGTLSHPFSIGVAKDYADALALSLQFFRAQRCGNNEPIMHAACHLNDAKAALDATGGWHDAGDYIKFMVTITYLDLNLLTTADYAQSYGLEAGMVDLSPANGKADLLEECKVGLDHILKMTADHAAGNFYMQVSGEEDHDQWRIPESDDKTGVVGNPRKLHKGWGGNLHGRSIACLSIAARVFAKSDPAFADICLKRAEALFALRKNWEKASPTVDFYGESSWKEDMVVGAAEYFKTTAKAEAKEYAVAHFAGMSGAELGWTTATWLSLAACYRAGIEADASLARMKADLESIKGKSAGEAFFLSSGYTWGTTAVFTGHSQKAIMYFYLTKDKTYLDVAAAQRDYLCGRNNWGCAFVQGLGEVYPEKSHSQLNDIVGLHKGAAVGGPSTQKQFSGGTDRFAAFQSNVIYYDKLEDYVTNEVAIDYAASVPFIFLHYAISAGGASGIARDRDDRGGRGGWNGRGAEGASGRGAFPIRPLDGRGWMPVVQKTIRAKGTGSGALEITDFVGRRIKAMARPR